MPTKTEKKKGYKQLTVTVVLVVLLTAVFSLGLYIVKTMVYKEPEIMRSSTNKISTNPIIPDPCHGDCYPDYIPWECPWNQNVNQVRYVWSNGNNRYNETDDLNNSVSSVVHVNSPESYDGRKCVKFTLKRGYKLDSLAISVYVSRDPSHGGGYYACFPLKVQDVRTNNVACFYDIFPNHLEYYPKDEPMTNISQVILNTSKSSAEPLEAPGGGKKIPPPGIIEPPISPI